MKSQFLHLSSSIGERLVHLAQVVEVIPMVHLECDQSSGLYRGLLHYRGRVIPTFDLSDQVTESTEDKLQQFLIVLNTSERELAIVAKEVYGVLEVDFHQHLRLNEGSDVEVEVVKLTDKVVEIVNLDTIQANNAVTMA